MQLTYALKPKQKAAELILPTEHPLNRIEPLFEYGSVEERLAGIDTLTNKWAGVCDNSSGHEAHFLCPPPISA